MIRVFYNAFIVLYPQLLKSASLFNDKAKEWVNGRKSQEKQPSPFSNSNQVIWFHAASVGEFEQGLPLMQAVKKTYPNSKIFLTFFSPSGYESKKNTDAADLVLYLPMDSENHAKLFIQKYRPSLAVFIKYEFWFYYLQTLKNNNIPTLLVSAVFRKDQPFFKWYGKFFRKMLLDYTHIFVQDQRSAALLSDVEITHYTISGDTRFDRVKEIADSFKPISYFENFLHQKTLVAGSTWLEDDEIISDFAKNNPRIKCIIAPHDINGKRLKECTQLYPSPILFSEINNYNDHQTIIIDNIGMLSRLYFYGTATYVGGGYSKDGIHNTLEAAVHFKPVVFGPEYGKYNEAKQLIAVKGAISVQNKEQLADTLNKLFSDDAFAGETGKNAGEFVMKNIGATEKIMNYIQENRLLTN